MIKIIKSIDWSDKKTINLIVEKVFFKRESFCKYNPIIIEHIDKLIKHFHPSNRREELYKIYLIYVKASILFENRNYIKAIKIVRTVLKTLNENDIYTTYDDINDLYLEIIKCLDNVS